MPLQNRVAPYGEILALAARGTLMGNRGGRLHDAQRRFGARRWTKSAWIACKLAFNERHRTVMAPGQYTELFFLDMATALAAGHRPCSECGRADLDRFRAAWPDARPRVAEIDKALHTARVDVGTRGKRTFRARLGDLPPGAMLRLADRDAPAYLHLEDAIRPWSFGGLRPGGGGRGESRGRRPHAGADDRGAARRLRPGALPHRVLLTAGRESMG
jgi:hypothetical protein